MANVTTLYATSVGDNDGWTLGAGADKVTAVRSNDGDTTHIYKDINTARIQTYYMDEFNPGNVEIVAVQVRSIMKFSGGIGSSINLRVRMGSDIDDTGAIILSGSYVTKANIWSTNPWTADPWTVSEINTLQGGVVAQWYATPPKFYATEVHMRIQWNDPLGTVVNHGLVNSGLVGGRIIV